MQGKELGPYRLLSELGSGGMGTVHAAEVTGDAPGLEQGYLWLSPTADSQGTTGATGR